MPETKDKLPLADKGPVEQQLAYTEKILHLERNLKTARWLRFFGRLSIALAPIGILAVYVATTLTWRRVDLRLVNIPAIIFILILIAAAALYVYLTIVGLDDVEFSVGRIELELELARERKRGAGALAGA